MGIMCTACAVRKDVDVVLYISVVMYSPLACGFLHAVGLVMLSSFCV
jgi:hypothetical protein